MKKLNKILCAVRKFVSKDYTHRFLNGIKFDLNRQTIEATDGHAAVIIKGTRGFVAGMANDYAEYLGLPPVGGDFDEVRIAPKNGKKYPVPELITGEDARAGNLWACLKFGEHDPEMCDYALVHNDQFPRLNQMCRALGTKLHLIPGPSYINALMQYGTSNYNGDELVFCIAQMPARDQAYDDNGNPLRTTISYESLDELDRDAMKQFTPMKQYMRL